jgi:hypothetical protein
MRSIPFAIVVVTSLLTLAAFTPAPAPLARPLRVDVPFAFVAGNTALPPGRYTMERNFIPLLLTVRSANEDAHATVLTRGVKARGPELEGRVVFRRYGYQRFLGEIWGEGSRSGRGVPPSASEQASARRGADVVRVVVAARP